MAIKGQVVIRPMMYVALSYDHRIVDGLEAVQFLVRVKELIEDPGQMLLEGVIGGRPAGAGPSSQRSMRPCVALLAVVLASPAIAAAQGARTAPPASSAPPAGVPSTDAPPADLANGRGAHQAPPRARRRRFATRRSSGPEPTFRTSVTERVDIWKFWGEPDEVAAYVRPNGGTWHHEFQNMVTPDEFKGYGGILGNGEKLQLAATSLAFAGAHEAAGDRHAAGQGGGAQSHRAQGQGRSAARARGVLRAASRSTSARRRRQPAVVT